MDELLEHSDETLNDQAIKKKLGELKIDDEDGFHAKLINDVLQKGITKGLAGYSDDIAPAKLRQLTESLTQLEIKTKNSTDELQEQTTINLILDILVRLEIDNEEETSHDKIVDVVLKSGTDAIEQFSEFIPPKKFAQLVSELKKKVTIPNNHSPQEEENSINAAILTLEFQIDFNYFNALDSSVDSKHADFIEEVEKSFGQPDFAELIAQRMIYLIKRQQNLTAFIEDVQKSSDETISLRQLLCEFLLNCSDDVRVKCYQLLSANNPVPAIIGQSGEYLAIESHWITMDDHDDEANRAGLSTTTRILSCGLEAACKGKSTLLNNLFKTSFEEDEYDCNQRFFNGTIDMQLVRNFGAPGHHLCIADAHGVVSEPLLEKMAGAFDVILVHVDEKSCGLVKNTKLIDKLAKRVQKRVFVIVRDSTVDSPDNCCDQEAMKRTFPKLAGVFGSVHGARIRLCHVLSLMCQDYQAELYFDKLRDFLFDEMCSFGISSEVVFTNKDKILLNLIKTGQNRVSFYLSKR